MKLRLKGQHFVYIEEIQAKLQQVLNTLRRQTSLIASKNGKITGFIVYKPTVTTLKVMVGIRTYSKYSCYYKQIIGNFG